MSEDNNNQEENNNQKDNKKQSAAEELNNDLNEMIGDVKESAKKAYNDAKQATSGFTEDAKESAKAFASGAKEAISNKKVLAGILAIFFGSLGIHKFVLGYNKEGTILLGLWVLGAVLSCVGIGVFLVWILGIVGLVEGIIYLTKSDEDFMNTYQTNKKPWF